MPRLCLLVSVALLAALFVPPAVDPRPRAIPLQDFAPTKDFEVLDCHLLVGPPDFTGLPTWVLEEVTLDEIDGPGDRRKSHWRANPRTLLERPIGSDDYLHSGMSKGHFGSAANHKRTQAAIDATHDYWNAGPQEQTVNAQAWERTEERERELVRQGARVIAVIVRVFELQPAGSTDEGCPLWSLRVTAQGPHQLWRPTHFAKSIRIELGGRVWLENYLIANDASVAHDNIEAHRVACDEIERKINTNLWPAPPQLAGEARVEWLERQEELESKR